MPTWDRRTRCTVTLEKVKLTKKGLDWRDETYEPPAEGRHWYRYEYQDLQGVWHRERIQATGREDAMAQVRAVIPIAEFFNERRHGAGNPAPVPAGKDQHEV